jgi:hypothetical protein
LKFNFVAPHDEFVPLVILSPAFWLFGGKSCLWPALSGGSKRYPERRSRDRRTRETTPHCGSKRRVEKTIRKYTSFDEMKADEYRYWQSRPVWERMDAVEELIETAYALKGWEIEPNVPRLQRPFVRLPCPWR